MKKTVFNFFIIFFLVTAAASAEAQVKLDLELKLFISDSVTFRNSNGDILADPFTGGIESPKFFKMELNGDNKEDLIVFDRKNTKISTYINNGGFNNSIYRHSPEFEYLFPKGRNNYYIIDVDRDGFKDIICGDPIQNWVNFYKNDGKIAPELHFTFQSNLKYLHFSPPAPGEKNTLANLNQHIPALEDLDNDGDLDFITLGIFGGNLEVYYNMQEEKGLPKDSLDFILGELCFGYFTEGTDNSINIAGCNSQKYYTRRHAGGSSIFMIDLDKDGDKDLLMGNNGGFDNLISLKNGYEEYTTSYDSMISWDSVFPKNTVPAKIKTFPSVSYEDIDGDGIKDLIVCPTWNADNGINGMNQTMLYINAGQNDSPIFNHAGNNFLMSQSIDLGENVSPAFWDFDNDGDFDLFITHSGNFENTSHVKDQVALYQNIGTKTKPDFQLIDLNFGDFKRFGLTYSRLCIYDLDNNGKPEFYFGQLDGSIHRYDNNGSNTAPSFSQTTKAFGNVFASFGYAAPAFYDYDQDGKTDLILGGNLGDISYYRNTGTNVAPSFQLMNDKLGNMFTNEFSYRTNPPMYEGTGASTPLVTDLNGDGNMEVIAGSLSGEIFAWKIGSNPNDTFVQFESFIKYLNVQGDTLSNYFFGKNTALAAADLDGDTIQDILVGTDAGGFFYLSGKARVFEVSVPQLKTFKMTLFPNPTNGKFTINELPSNVDKTITVLNLQGKELYQTISTSSNKVLDLTDYPQGVYLIRIDAEGYQSAFYKLSKLND